MKKLIYLLFALITFSTCTLLPDGEIVGSTDFYLITSFEQDVQSVMLEMPDFVSPRESNIHGLYGESFSRTWITGDDILESDEGLFDQVRINRSGAIITIDVDRYERAIVDLERVPTQLIIYKGRGIQFNEIADVTIFAAGKITSIEGTQGIFKSEVGDEATIVAHLQYAVTNLKNYEL